jgi:hypothetical protein
VTEAFTFYVSAEYAAILNHCVPPSKRATWFRNAVLALQEKENTALLETTVSSAASMKYKDNPPPKMPAVERPAALRPAWNALLGTWAVAYHDTDKKRLWLAQWDEKASVWWYKTQLPSKRWRTMAAYPGKPFVRLTKRGLED